MKIWKHMSENYGKPLHVPVNPHFPYFPDQNCTSKLGVQLYRTLLVQIHPHESSWIHIASSFKLVSSPGTRFSRSCIPLGDRKLQAFEYFDFFGGPFGTSCVANVSVEAFFDLFCSEETLKIWDWGFWGWLPTWAACDAISYTKGWEGAPWATLMGPAEITFWGTETLFGQSNGVC